MNLFQNITGNSLKKDSLFRLIYINVIVFFLVKAVAIILQLFNINVDFSSAFLSLPSSVHSLILKPWTLISYMFLHSAVMHILFNMLSLFWFGNFFLMFFSEKQLVGLYVVGGIVSALFFVIAFNFFPFYSPLVSQGLLMGASGSVMAIVVASAVKSPNMELTMLLIGRIRLKYIAGFFVLLSFFGITSENSGGQLAHLGGALAGYIYVIALQRNFDLTKWVSWILDVFATLFTPRKTKFKSTKNRKMTDAQFNMAKARKNQDINKILDKIKTSGYNSLSDDEKRRLFEQNQ